MKKLNYQLYIAGSGRVTNKDNNNLFVDGDFSGAKIISVSSIKDSDGKEIIEGGGSGDVTIEKAMEKTGMSYVKFKDPEDMEPTVGVVSIDNRTVTINQDYIEQFVNGGRAFAEKCIEEGTESQYQLQNLNDEYGGTIQFDGSWWDVRIWDYQPDGLEDFFVPAEADIIQTGGSTLYVPNVTLYWFLNEDYWYQSETATPLSKGSTIFNTIRSVVAPYSYTDFPSDEIETIGLYCPFDQPEYKYEEIKLCKIVYVKMTRRSE